MPTPRMSQRGMISTTSTSIFRRRAATARVRPAMPPPTTRIFMPAHIARERTRLLRFQPRSLDDIAKPVVIAAHAGAEFLGALFERLETAFTQGPHHFGIVLNGVDIFDKLVDDRLRRAFWRN